MLMSINALMSADIYCTHECRQGGTSILSNRASWDIEGAPEILRGLISPMSAAEKKDSIFEEIANARPVQSTRDVILMTASRVFIEHGYENASMDLVAKEAGTARRTLYNQFPDGKEELFRAVVERMWRAFPAMDIGDDAEALADPEVGLRRIGQAVSSFWGPPLAVAFLRMVIADGRRFPDLIKSFFEMGKTPAVTSVRNYIGEMARRGLLRIDNIDLASKQFLGLIDEAVLWVRLMGDDRALTAGEIEEIIESGVAMFLRFYRPA